MSDTRKVNWKNRMYVEALGKELAATHICADSIARHLQKRFPDKDITRYVVIGALNRPHVLQSLRELFPDSIDELLLRYRGNATSNNGQILKQRPKAIPKPAVPLRPKKIMRQSLSPAIPLPVASVDLLPLQTSDGLVTKILTLTKTVCSFGIGDPRDKHFAFCGRPRVRGAFCEDHARVAYQPKQPRRL